ncbi:uncharacterized protein LOC143623165 [Bidens hawaiensis]|uniref:uncharacterized protein LOC143623165 n=1 Tax=Bidens hawaiensis TaxID=980011 RepID=UPI0040499C2D
MGDSGVDDEVLISKLDISNPLYLHPSDLSNLSIVSIKLNGKCIKPTENDVLANQWDKCNSVVLTWILNSVSEELYVGQVYSQNAFENGSTVAEYYHRLTTMWKQFDIVVQLPSCYCQASKGLDDVYQPVRTNMLTCEPLPTVKTAFSIISREESHRFSSGFSKGRSQNVGFLSKNTQSFDNKKRFNRGPNPNLKCTHCNKIGHMVETCFEIVGYPHSNRFKPTSKQFSSSNSFPTKGSSSNSAVSTLTPDQVSKLLGLLDEKTDDGQLSSNVGDVTGFSISVKHPNGSNAMVTKTGNFKLNDDVTLTDAFVVPEYNDSFTKRTLVTDSQVDGLYLCVCHLAKQRRDPFPLSDQKTNKVGQLLHLDVWGPYIVQSKEGYR